MSVIAVIALGHSKLRRPGSAPTQSYVPRVRADELGGTEIPCYVLDNGQRVIGRTAYTESLTGIKGGGDLEKYLGVSSLKPFINSEMLLEGMVSFSLPEVEGLERNVKGLPADLAIEVWRGFVRALEATVSDEKAKLTTRQMEMALKASFLLGACAKGRVGRAH